MKTFRKFFSTEFIVMALITVVLIAGAFFLFSITASGLSADDNTVWNDYYAPLEEGYVEDVREYLGENGFANSGVSLTHVTSEDLGRVYTLSIHNRRFDRIPDDRMEEMMSLIEGMGFADERCTITVKII